MTSAQELLDRTPIDLTLVESGECWIAGIRRAIASPVWERYATRLECSPQPPTLQQLRLSKVPTLVCVEVELRDALPLLQWIAEASELSGVVVVALCDSRRQCALLEPALREAGALRVVEEVGGVASALASVLPGIEQDWRRREGGLAPLESLWVRLPWRKHAARLGAGGKPT